MRFIHMADDSYLAQDQKSDLGFRIIPNRKPYYNSKAVAWELYTDSIFGKSDRLGTFKRMRDARDWAERFDRHQLNK